MSFSGAVSSDFMKLVKVPTAKKVDFIDFTSTDFIALRSSMIDYIKAVYPNEYQYFVESDLGMVFIELIAYMGGVLSFKADMLANENFLATAKQKKSVKKLLELIGIRMKGPISSAAEAQITFDQIDTNPVEPVIITPANRVIETVSPEDGAALTFTLYKVVNGLVDTANSTGTISLYRNETDNPLDGSTVYSNLVVQEGTLVQETGEFASTESLKSIPLTQSPVVEGSIQVFIESDDSNASGAYTEVDNIYFASGSTDRIFQIVYDDDYKATVIFGDGTVGQSPSLDSNYIVHYRIGGGSRGNIVKGAFNTDVPASSRNVASIAGVLTNTTLATGGSDAETIEHAKKYGPLTFRRQDRLVTLEDYTTFANSFISNFGTVGKAAAATRKAFSSANVIDIYVLEKANNLQLQKATPNFKTQLLDSINKKKMATDEIVIADGLIRTVDLVTTIRIDREQEENQSQIVTKARDKILSYFSPDNRDFGQPIVVADLNRQIFDLDEIIFSTIDNINQNIVLDFNEIAQINNITINVELLD